MIKTTKNLFLEYCKNDSGATAIEYALLAMILAVGVIGGATGLGKKTTDVWNVVTNKVDKT